MYPLPPLNTLHTFERVARYLSFQQAAEKLGVTPTAVSHQIKVLEEYLGLSLFRRRPRPLALTEAGQVLYPSVREGLDTIAEAIAQIKSVPDSIELTVSVTTVFAAKWLVPRLSEFQQAHPDIDLRLQASNDRVDLRTQSIDLAIRYGNKNYPELVVHTLMSDKFMPVCSPHLLDKQHPINGPSDLLHHSLLHFEWIHFGTDAPNWKNWFALAEVNASEPNRGLKFDEETLAIQAAIAGQGVALCSNIHVADDVALGFLVQPFEVALPGFHYSAVYLENHAKKHLILKFIDWLAQMSNQMSN